MKIKIIRKQNKNAEKYGKYTFWVYEKNDKGKTISRGYINSDIDIDKKALINFINESDYIGIDFLWDDEETFIYKQNNYNRVVVGLKKNFYLDKETYDRKYKNFHEIQKTREFRNHNNFDYYNSKNVCVIHFKRFEFGHARIHFSGLRLENNLTQEFIDEYLKYFDLEKTNKIKDAIDLVEYVVKNKLPVIFYDNLNDKEMGIGEVTDWLLVNVLGKGKKNEIQN